MKQYNQLTEDDRIEIYVLLQAGKSKAFIAQHLQRSRSTITRELTRNTGQRGYRPKQAHDKALTRRKQAHKAVKMTHDVVMFIEAKLRQEYSPEQIHGMMKNDPTWAAKAVSHERIYQHIWLDKKLGGDLYKHLRVASRKRRRKRGASKDHRGIIPNRVSIDLRPKLVDRKARFGDWEVDTMIGKDRKSALVTLVERKTLFTLMGRVLQRTAQAVCERIIHLLEPYMAYLHSITCDNGKEFACHEKIAQCLEVSVYFTHPYCSWERGLNEHTNGLIRQYLPKGTDFRQVTDHDVWFIMDRLNTRPRKTLGYHTPQLRFMAQVY
jgi:IS30 family transposase